MRNLWIKIVLILIVIIFILNIKVTTQQGINYQWHTVNLPLYLKLLDFFDRHYNYKQLVKRITKDANSGEEKVIKLFEWTSSNIKKVPEGYSIIDDHVWHIIVRGYGTDDQACDVFSTLCSYAGAEAIFLWLDSEDKTKRMPFSFVKIKDKWFVFDTYNSVYFKNSRKELASTEDIKNNNWKAEEINGKGSPDIEYKEYFLNIPNINNVALQRTTIQSPLNRLFFEIKKVINNKRHD